MMDQQPEVISGLQLWQWRNTAKTAAIATDVPPTEVDWLLQEVAGLDRLALRLESFKNQPQIKLQLPFAELETLWQKRLKERLPVQYITGVTPWRHFKIAVSNAVLIPRPETESLIDLALEAASLPLQQGHWADLGTGSGAIALGLADVFKSATIHAVDYSPQALAVAALNARNYGFTERIHFYRGFWWEPLEFLKGQFSGMVSNPPYIPTSTLPSLQPEVVNHEPSLALDGGADGLASIRHLVQVSSSYLQPGGIWLIEMMAGQAHAVKEMLHNHGSYCNIQIHTDLAGIQRFALAYKVGA
ncbi:peptide chain release factor N(5)-glutamine methyltransferase [Aetokthonos hydrillicola Thurmond2011]|uniref:Release factor glutamine methyltransferase n=1 Tax=Aetokthonos hydrillicola Thurmond2011 TaxID=2712845 RepID=A0AAP5MCK7_9CYAN|nr:peptide chain release factor N(5)-glutamine methyltransferase [Aetokthonos hydrillicola]MBO3458113.1 peptide chain release factor N(5)-glutamine methyltransferase [Aetokthonos hydrillicola CCALA 1050]MBW4584334.1 peptide chain release factor N(5)-glutamine methyltransferase [Aetokthonos hydrillicola CCALA 1050]MDR9898458.1 peptide chain release factor N(5)-glutamine methyltransferase [Aetokthonos hydrillicola Thurmond2011]